MKDALLRLPPCFTFFLFCHFVLYFFFNWYPLFRLSYYVAFYIIFCLASFLIFYFLLYSVLLNNALSLSLRLTESSFTVSTNPNAYSDTVLPSVQSLTAYSLRKDLNLSANLTVNYFKITLLSNLFSFLAFDGIAYSYSSKTFNTTSLGFLSAFAKPSVPFYKNRQTIRTDATPTSITSKPETESLLLNLTRYIPYIEVYTICAAVKRKNPGRRTRNFLRRAIPFLLDNNVIAAKIIDVLNSKQVKQKISSPFSN